MKFTTKFKTIIGATLLMFAITLSSCSITTPVNATSNPIGSKIGTSKGFAIIGLYLDIDTSIRTAAKNGGISRISTVDYKIFRVLGIYEEYTCIVTGE